MTVHKLREDVQTLPLPFIISCLLTVQHRHGGCLLAKRGFAQGLGAERFQNLAQLDLSRGFILA